MFRSDTFQKNNLMQLKGSRMLIKNYRPEKSQTIPGNTESQGLYEVPDHRFQFRFKL